MIKQLKFQRFLVMIYLGAAVGILLFWSQFFLGDLFLERELADLSADYEPYMTWKRSLVVPELILALTMLFSVVPLWTNRWMKVGLIAAYSSGFMALSLGVVGLKIGFDSRLYGLDHSFADFALEADLSMTVVGIVGLIILLRIPRADS